MGLETQLSMAGLIERDRLLVIPADDEAELEFRADALEKVLRQAHLQAAVQAGSIPAPSRGHRSPRAS
jgi:hypothetical protein